jgi:hypothetical protein
MHGNMCQVGMLGRLLISLVRLAFLDSGPANSGGCYQAGKHSKKGCA